MRLDKFISNNTDHSRSDVRKLVKAKRVEVNGELASAADQKIKKVDVVSIDGIQVEAVGQLYLMLNKPTGVVCANEDGQYPTVIDLLRNEKNFIGQKIKRIPFADMQIAGRLDVDTTGLVLLTNDGKWNHKVTAPTRDCKKVYQVGLARALAPEVPALFSRGVQLEGESKLTRPAMLQSLTPKKVRLTISEGKYHQVKRMFAAAGNHVEKLHRESIGGVKLDSALGPGQFRQLSKEELKTLSNPTPASLSSLSTPISERGLL